MGWVYLVTGYRIEHVKVGMWSGTRKGLFTRYQTYYGNDMNLQLFVSDDPRKHESMFKVKFKNYSICLELFDKKYWDEYILYFDTIPELEHPIKNRSKFYCNSCGYTTYIFGDFKEHCYSQICNGTFIGQSITRECSFCNKNFPGIFSFSKHLKICTKFADFKKHSDNEVIKMAKLEAENARLKQLLESN
jgi:hypothetical protein